MTYTPAVDVDALLAIDIHVHAGVSGKAPRVSAPQAGRDDTLARQTQRTGAGGQTPDETAAYYRERNIAAAIWGVDTLSTSGSRPGSVSNEEMLEAASKHNDILIPFVMVDPWRGKAGCQDAQRLIDAGARGFKFHPLTQQFFVNDRHFYPLYEVLAANKVPALFHTGQTAVGQGAPGGGGVRLKYGNPMFLDDVAVDFPDMPIIMAHPSFPWQDEALSVALHKPQVYIDLSGWSPKYFPPQLVQYANTLIKNKVLFGSDHPMITTDRWLADFEQAGFRDEVKPLLLKENAARLLGLRGELKGMAFANFWERAARAPEHVAVIEPDEHRVSAAELLASTNQVVHGLRALGLQPGDAIAAVLPNSLQAYEIFLGMQQAGWYLTPINFHLVGPEIAYILKDCEARAFIAHERFAATATAGADEAGLPAHVRFSVGSIDGFRPYAELKAGQPTDMPSDRMLGSVMNYTSGTTGRPKGVRRALSGQPPLESDLGAPLAGYHVSQDETDNVHLLACPWYHTAPLVMSIPSLHLGHTLSIVDKFEPEKTLQVIERDRVTITHLVPTQFVRMLALPEEVRARYDVSSLRHVIHGAAPCPPEVKRRMIAWWGPVLDEYYASTEGVGGTIIFSEEWLGKPGSVGKARGDNEIVIMNDDGVVLPPGEIGTVYSTARGGFEYFKDPEKTARARTGKYSTVGDVGYLDEDGYLYLCDRKVDMIISGGVNIYPAEVEHALINHPKVLDVAVFGVPSEEWGEEVKAVVEPAAGVSADSELVSELLEFLRERIARYKVPKSVDFVSEMPRDPSGKLYKRKLRDPYWAGRARAI